MRSFFRNGHQRGRKAFIAAALFLCALVWTGCNQDRALAVRQLNEGLQAQEAGRTLDAVEQLKQAADSDPTFARPHYILGQLYQMKLNEPERATRHYRLALDRAPGEAKYAYKLGSALAEQVKHEEALEYLETAVENDTEHAAAWYRLGRSQEAMGEHAQAVESYMKSIRANPRLRITDEDPGGIAYHALADLYVQFDFFDKALKVYDNGILNNPESPRLYRGKGVAQLELERPEEAVASFEKALEADPSNGTAQFNLGVAYRRMGEEQKAIDAFEQYLSRANKQKEGTRVAAAQGFIQKIRQRQKE